jgi:hypothetical protein
MKFALLFVIVALTIVSAVSADTFYWSGYGSSPFGLDGYNTIGYSDVGVGHYGVYITPQGTRGGWSTQGSSGSFGYAYDTDLGTVGNQGGFTSLSVNSGGLRGSYVNGWQGGYGAFVVGGGSVNYQPYNYGGWGASRWTGYPSGIPYASGGSYGYYRNTWY